MEILSAAAFAVRSMSHRNKQKIPGQLVFGWYMILPINPVVNWRYIRHQKQAQIEKYVIHENSTRIDYDYNIGDKVMVRRKQAYKYKTPFQGPYEIIQMCTNRAVTIQTGAVTARLNIRC